MPTWKRPIRLGLQARLTILTVLGLAAIFAAMGYIGLRNQAASMDVVLQQRVALAETLATHVEYHIIHPMLAELAAAAEHPGFDLSDDNPEPEQEVLADLYRSGMFTYDVFVADARGVVLAVEPQTLRAGLVGADFSAHPHIRRALETGQPQASGVIPGVAAPSPLVSLVAPVKNAQSEIVGLIGGALDPAGPAISGFIAPMALGETGYAQVIDGQGMVVASTHPGRAGTPGEHRDLILSLIQRGEPTILPDTSVVEEGKEFHEVIAFAPIPRLGWAVTIEQDRAEALAPVIQARDRILLAAAGTLALAIVFVWLTTREVTKPMRALSGAARRIASGDLGTPVTVSGPDEVAELGHSFEAMRRKLAAWGEELEAAVQIRTRQLSVLYAIDRTAAQSLELDEILNDALDKVLEVLDVEAGGIYLLEPDQETMTLRVHRGLSDEFVENIRRIRLGEGISGRAAAERKPVVLDVPDYPTERLAPFIVREGFQTLASTPFVSAGELVGALNVATRRPRAFPPEELELLTSIGQQLGGVVANAQLHADTRRQATQLGLLYDAGLTLNRELDPRVQLEFLCKIAMTAVHADRAEFFRCDAAGSQVRFEISAGYGEEKQKALTGLTFPMGEARGLVGRVAQNRLPLYLSDVSADPRWITIDSEIRSALWVPVFHEKELLGTLGVFSARVNAFTPHDERLLVLFANQVAVAMENTRLFEATQHELVERERAESQVRRHAAHAEALARTAARLNAQLDFETVLNAVCEETARAFNAPAASVGLYDGERDVIYHAADIGLPPDYRQRAIPLPRAVYDEHTKRAGAVSVVPDIQALPGIPNAPLQAELGIRTIASASMFHVGQLVGALNVICRGETRVFLEHELALLRGLADQAAIALQNARLHQETRQRAERLSILNRIAHALAATLDLDELLEIVHREIMAVVEADTFFVALYDREANELDFRIRIDKGVREPPERRLMAAGLTAAVVTGKQPLLIRDFEREKDHLPPVKLWGTMESPQSWLGLPLLLGPDVIGVFSVQAYRTGAFDEADQQVLSTIADAVAVAVENARLYEAERRRAARLDAMQRLGIELAGLRDESSVLTALVTRAAALADSPTCTVMLVDETTEEAVLAAHYGLPEDTPPGLRVPLTLPVIRRSLESGEPILLADIDRNAVEMRAILVRRDIQAFFAYPMVWEGRALGFITLSSLAPHRPSAEEVTAYRLLAERAAAALVNAGLYAAGQQQAEELARLNQRLLTLQEIGRAVSSSLDPKEVLRVVRERIALVVPQAYPPLFTLVDEEAGLIRTFIVAPESPILATIKETTGLSLGDLSMPLSAVRDSPSWPKWMAGEAVVGYDLAAMLRAALPGAPLAEFQKAMGIESMVFAPLRTQARLHGLMLVFVQREVNDDDVTLLLALAAQAAVAVEKARLFEAVQQELTERKRVAEALRESQERYRALFEDSPSALWEEDFSEVKRQIDRLRKTGVQDLHAYFAKHPEQVARYAALVKVVAVNRAALQLHQAGSKEELLAGLGRILGEEALPAFVEELAAIAEGRPVFESEFVEWTLTGDKKQVVVKLSVAPGHEATWSKVLVSVVDITERKRVEDALRASEQEYRTLVENATELIWTLDTEGRYTFVNRQIEEASGRKAEDWLGTSYAPLIPPEDLLRVQQIFRETLDGKSQSYETRAFGPDGALRYLSVNTTPLYRDGEVVGTISFARDVTAEKEAGAALTQRMAELSSLFEVSSALRGVEGVEHILPVIVDKAVASCRADCGNVLLLDESGEMLVCRYGTGARQRLVGARIRLGHGVSGRVAQSGAPHLSPDFQHDPLLAFGPATSARLPEIASDACVPLRVGEQIVGAMHVSIYTARTFTEAELRLLTAIADMAANAIHRAGLFEQLEHRVRELSALFDTSKMVTASLRIEDVLAFVVSAAARAAHAEGCYLFLWDEREKRLALRASQGFLAGEVGRLKYRLGEGLVGWVFLEGQTVHAPNLAADPRWKRDPEHEAPLPSGLALNALVVPLRLGDKTLGVLGVINKIGAPAPSTALRASFTENNQSFLAALGSQVAVAIENARLYEDVRGLSVAAIRSLATAIDARDPYTRGHSEGVTRLAVQLARELGWSGADLEMLEFAALLHDVGKIAVPDAILRKIEPLTSGEWNIIRLHPYHSAQIVKPIEPLQRIVPWVYHHQERWDGTGYPDGLKGEAIPLASRIIAVVDAFNAMTTDRPYRKALSVAEARAEIERGAGGQFDPMIAKTFLKMVREAG